MYKKAIVLGMFSILLLTPLVSVADLYSDESTSGNLLWFQPDKLSYSIGDTFSVDLYADILETNAILGFLFDLSFDGGNSTVDAGEGVSSITFTGFTANSNPGPFGMLPPMWDPDRKTIAGEVNFNNLEDVYGTGILLGTLSFEAHALSTEIISLTPRAGGFIQNGNKGLLWFDPRSVVTYEFVPNNATAEFVPVPEPATMFLFSVGIITLIGLRRKNRTNIQKNV